VAIIAQKVGEAAKADTAVAQTVQAIADAVFSPQIQLRKSWKYLNMQM
jgi:hypothetical protein